MDIVVCYGIIELLYCFRIDVVGVDDDECVDVCCIECVFGVVDVVEDFELWYFF